MVISRARVAAAAIVAAQSAIEDLEKSQSDNESPPPSPSPVIPALRLQMIGKRVSILPSVDPASDSGTDANATTTDDEKPVDLTQIKKKAPARKPGSAPPASIQQSSEDDGSDSGFGSSDGEGLLRVPAMDSDDCEEDEPFNFESEGKHRDEEVPFDGQCGPSDPGTKATGPLLRARVLHAQARKFKRLVWSEFS